MILVGTSGWSYDDWVGPVYPEELRHKAGAWLEHYIGRFATVEVNSTFYKLPSERTVEGWIEKAGRAAPSGGFEFSVKAPQDVTHTAMVQGDREMVRDVLAQFRDLVAEPLGRAGLLGAVLLQLSPHFHGGEEQLELLDLALTELKGPPVAVEFRHRTWLEEQELSPGAADLLKAHGAALCAVDGPSFPPMLRSLSRHAYVRFHGRRADAWFAKGEARRSEDGLPARYDYLYKTEELEPWARVLRANEERFERIRVYFNNHPRGQAVANAGDLRRLMGSQPPARPPARQGKAQRRLAEFGVPTGGRAPGWGRAASPGGAGGARTTPRRTRRPG